MWDLKKSIVIILAISCQSAFSTLKEPTIVGKKVHLGSAKRAIEHVLSGAKLVEQSRFVKEALENTDGVPMATLGQFNFSEDKIMDVAVYVYSKKLGKTFFYMVLSGPNGYKALPVTILGREASKLVNISDYITTFTDPKGASSLQYEDALARTIQKFQYQKGRGVVEVPTTESPNE